MDERAIQLKLMTCPICEKRFVPAVYHSYRIGCKSGQNRLVCSYTCMRDYERKNGLVGLQTTRKRKKGDAE